MRVLASALLLALGIGAWLRFAGSGWGLPDERHVASYRADEWRAVVMALRLEPLAGELVPLHKGAAYFNWGSLQLYAFGLAAELAEAVGWLRPEGDFETWSVETFARGHLVGRWVSALFGLATVLLVYALGARWYGRGVGLAAALVLALSPLDVLEAHSALVNVGVAFWCLVALGLIARALERGTTKALFAAGAATGLAVAAKLSALPLLPLLVGAAAWSGLAGERERMRRVARRLAVGLGGALVAFLVASPAVLTDPQLFGEQAWKQLVYRPSVGTGLTFAGTGNGYAFLLLENLPLALGWPLWLAAVGGVGWAAARALRAARGGGWRRPSPALAGDAVALAWLCVQIVPLGLSETRFLRYLLPITPVLSLFAARFVLELAPRLPRRGALALRAAALVALAYTALYTGAQVAALRGADPRDQAVVWFERHVPRDAKVALLGFPTHLVPPVHPFARAWPERPSAAAAARGESPDGRRWVLLQLDPERLVAERPDYVVYSPIELEPYLRVGEPEGARLGALLAEEYREVGGDFDNAPRLFGLRFGDARGDTRGWAPASVPVRVLARRDLMETGSR